MDLSLRPGQLDSLDRRLKQLESEVAALGGKAASGKDKTAVACLAELKVGQLSLPVCCVLVCVSGEAVLGVARGAGVGGTRRRWRAWRSLRWAQREGRGGWEMCVRLCVSWERVFAGTHGGCGGRGKAGVAMPGGAEGGAAQPPCALCLGVSCLTGAAGACCRAGTR